MKRTICRLLTVLALLAPVPLAAQAQISEPKYVVFIHTGPKKADDPVIRQILGYVVKSGFLVREPDANSDFVGGPGIDYFSDDALPAAKRLADLLNGLLPKFQIEGVKIQPLNPRKQNVKNPATYLGVWLFTASSPPPPAAVR